MGNIDVEKLDFKKMGGFLPAIIQDFESKQVLMLGFMDKQALSETIKEGRVSFWSKKKQILWKKGEKLGNLLRVVSIKKDYGGNALLINVKPVESVYRNGFFSCFDGKNRNNDAEIRTDFLSFLFKLIQERRKNPKKGSYTNTLLAKGLDAIIQKVGEESSELIIASKNKSKKRFVEEFSDLIYHLMVLLVEKNVDLREIAKELKERHDKTK